MNKAKPFNLLLVCITIVMCIFPVLGNSQVVGIFTGKASIGDDGGQGDALFSNDTYEVRGSGSDVGGTADGLFWTYKEITGNFMMAADMQWGAADVPVPDATASIQSKKMGIMVRESAKGAGSRQVFAMMRREYGADITYRSETGGASLETPGIVIKSSNDTNTIMLCRSGADFSMYRKTTSGFFRFIGKTSQPNMPNTIAAGLAVSSHSATMTENAFFSNVSITPIPSLITAKRTISKAMANAGEQITIQITVNTGTENIGDVTVMEIPSKFLEINSIGIQSGDLSGDEQGNIFWVMEGGTGEKTLTYDFFAPATPGIIQFPGRLSVGNLYTIPTMGDTTFASAKTLSGKKAAMLRKFSLDSFSDYLITLDLQSYFGVSLTEYDDANSDGFELPANLDGMSLTYISETITSANITAKNYMNSNTPVIIGEQMLMDDFANNPGPGPSWMLDNLLEIVDNKHPITKGFLTGVVQLSPEFLYLGHYNNPPAGVRILAIEPGNPTRARLWVVEKGAEANGVVTPGLRIGTFLGGRDGYANNPYGMLNEAGKKLILQAFAYGLGEESPIPSAVESYMLYN